MPLKLITF